MDWTDPVVWGSIGSVVIAIIIFVFLIFKVRSLMNQDAERHKQEGGDS